MKKMLYLLFVFYCMNAYSKQDLNGMYCSADKDRTDCVVMFGNRFVYMEYGYVYAPIHFCCRDIFGNATYSRVGCEFIELHNSSLRDVVDKMLKINQKKVKSISDSTSIRISMPCLKNELLSFKINYVYKNDTGTECGELEEIRSWKTLNPENGSVKPFILPGNIKNIQITIGLIDVPIIQQNVDTELFYGALYYQSPVIDVRKCANSIDIELSSISEESFLLYHLNGEYVRMQENKLIWRGVVFEKSNTTDDIKFMDELTKRYHKRMNDNAVLDLIDEIRTKVYGGQDDTDL